MPGDVGFLKFTYVAHWRCETCGAWFRISGDVDSVVDTAQEAGQLHAEGCKPPLVRFGKGGHAR